MASWTRSEQADKNTAREIVSKVGGVYADLNEQRMLVKPHSSLPCSWFYARECFVIAYENEYLNLSEELRDSYHHVYRELSFFIEDKLWKEFNSALDIAARRQYEQISTLGGITSEDFCRNLLASGAVMGQTREEIWRQLAEINTCPRKHLIVLFETLSYCGALHRAMWDEWAAFANLVAFRAKGEKQA
jgi:hypothetical protein